jgi:hypothetical protein
MAKGPPLPSAKDRETIRALASTAVLAQGNIFIRELLRRKELPIGSTKEDFETNLLRAIDTGELTLEDVSQWLDEVEGWGNQHVYLYSAPRGLVSDPIWRSPGKVKQRLFSPTWNDLKDLFFALRFI